MVLARIKLYGQANRQIVLNIVIIGIYISESSVIACLTLLAELSDESYQF